MISIDGRQGEGGGQVLRSSLAFAALTGKAFSIHNIRGNRPKPGLRAQHVAAVRLAASLCRARVSGVEVGSHELSFQPCELVGGRHHVDVGTAGSVTLLTQASLLPALMCGEPVELVLEGGTDVPMSPPLDYLDEVVLPYYRRLGSIELIEERRGFVPAGQGRVRLLVEGHGEAVVPLRLTRWEGPVEPHARVVAAEGLRSAEVAERVASGLEQELGVESEICYQSTSSASVVVTIWGRSEEVRVGVGGLGRRRLSSERLANQVCRLWQERVAHKNPVEEHLADQLVPLLSLIGGEMACQVISLHCQTNMEICGLFSGAQFSIEGNSVRALGGSRLGWRLEE